MLSSARRAELRAVANGIETIVQIGKGGITDEVVKQADGALSKRELIKLRVLESSMLTAREACDRMAALTKSEPVQVIGTRFVLYRENKVKKKKPAAPTPARSAAGPARKGAAGRRDDKNPFSRQDRNFGRSGGPFKKTGLKSAVSVKRKAGDRDYARDRGAPIAGRGKGTEAPVKLPGPVSIKLKSPHRASGEGLRPRAPKERGGGRKAR